jgi:putative ABC transport system permease protein
VPTDNFLLLSTRFDVLRIATGQAAAEPRYWRLVTPGAGPPVAEAADARTGVDGTLVRASFLGTNQARDARLLPEAPPVDTDVPVVLERSFAARIGAAPGATLDANVGGRSLTLQVASIVDRLPGGLTAGVPDDGVVPARPAPGVLVDLAVLGEVTRDVGAQTPPDPTEWWHGGLGSWSGAEVRAALPDAGVLASDEVVARRLADPFAAGLGRLLLLAALAALAVALGALLLGDAVAASGRRHELAVLRALGLDTAQVRRLLVLEHAVVGGAAVVAGTALGLAIAPVLVPGLVGVPAVPGAGVRIAWLPVLGAALVLAAAVAAGGVTAGRRAARLQPVAVLREDAT